MIYFGKITQGLNIFHKFRRGEDLPKYLAKSNNFQTSDWLYSLYCE